MDSLPIRTGDTVQIICGDSSWTVDKAKICAESEVITTGLASGMKGSRSGTIHHEEFDEATVERMVSYIKTGSYDVKQEVDLEVEQEAEQEVDQAADEKAHQAAEKGRCQISENSHEEIPRWFPAPASLNRILLAHTSVYGIAEYYEISSLKAHASKRFAMAGERGWQPEGFSELVKEVYRVSWPLGVSLCDTLCDYAAQYRAAIMRDSWIMEELKVDPELQKFLASLFRKSVRLEILDRSRHNLIMRRKDEDVIAARYSSSARQKRHNEMASRFVSGDSEEELDEAVRRAADEQSE
jgi:hypothetical protein